MTITKQTMANVDTAWLHMDRPTNLMMIAGYMAFDGPMDYERLVKTVEQRLLRFDRFRQVVVEPSAGIGSVHWQTDPNFDLRAHIHRIALPEPGDEATLRDLLSDIYSTPLDRTRPLWQFHVIEKYGRGSVLACRLHHAIADGIALTRVLLSLTDNAPDTTEPPPAAASRSNHQSRAGFVGRAFRPVGRAYRTSRRLAGVAVQQGLETVRHPGRLVDVTKMGVAGTMTLGRLALRSPDPANMFRGDLGVMKRAAWSDRLSLAEVKATGKALEGTINDIILSAVTGALRRYMLEHDQRVDGQDFRALIPVNLRPFEETIHLGNRFGLVFLSLPVGIANAYDRLAELRRRMNELKNSPEAVVAYGVLFAIGMTPSNVEDLFVDFFGSKATAVMTNVPGPQEQLFLAGAPIREIMAWVPMSGRLGLGVSIISYNGGVQIGIMTDEGLVPDPERIITHFYVEMEALKELAQVLPVVAPEAEPVKAG